MAEISAWRRWLPRMAAPLLLLTASALQAQPVSAGSEFQDRLIQLYQEHSNAVVRVKVATEDLDENGKPRISLLVFSGFFVSPDGLVLTNSTATTQANRIWVEKNGLSYLAESVGNDPKTNVGLLQVLKLPRSFSHIPLEAANGIQKIGSVVMAITSPLDFNPTPSIGLVTGAESSFSNFVFPFTYTRVGIPGGPAEGGSPILNLDGHLVGISVASVPEVRSSYVVPTRALVRLHAQLKSTGTVRYGAIPVEFSERPDRLNVAKEITAAQVSPNSSAAKAGLAEGDVLRSIDGQAVNKMNHLRDAIFYAEIGATLKFDVEREGTRLTFDLPVEALEDMPTASTPASPATPEATRPPGEE
jgi:S1-C subfamily serine protease